MSEKILKPRCQVLDREACLRELWAQFKTKTKESFWAKIYISRQHEEGKKSSPDFEKDLTTTAFIDAFAVYFEDQIDTQKKLLIHHNKALPQVREWSINVY